MTQNLKIEVVTENISESGVIVTSLVTKEELSQVATKKADLGADGKIPTSQLPDNILNTTTIVDQVKTQLESTIQDGIQEANSYAESYVDDAVVKKADLGDDGKVPKAQLPSLDEYTEFKTSNDSIKNELTTVFKKRTDQLELSKASLDDNGKVLREQLPEFDELPGVPELVEELSTKAVQNISHVIDQAVVEATTKSNAVAADAAARAEAAAVASNIGSKVYNTPSDGVKAGTGVPVSSYFNVRSPRSEYYVDEYLNRNGVPEATGKSYPSAKGLQDAQAIAAQSAAIAEAAATAATIGAGVFATPEAGVASGTGVDDGAYFNVRSPNDESYIDEYQNVGGVPTPTGKTYPSGAALNNIPHNNLKDRDVAGAHPAIAILDVSGRNQQEVNNKIFKEMASLADFGAKGNDDQTLYAANYQSDNSSQPITITQQTADGLAINRAIKWLRNRGGGALYIPPCEEGKSYRIYGYLERIDFPCVIYGAGASSLLKSCDNSPTDKNGYGILHIEPTSVSEITFMNFKIDGNAHVRTKPTSEWRSYNLHICGKPQLRLFNFTSVNSAIDCLCTRYKRPFELSENESVWVKVVNCHFEDAYRNTLSLVSGNSISFVNCEILGGGFVHGGTNPRYCLDIEPTSGDPTLHARNIKFTNCTFARAINAVVGGTWGQADFIGCTIDASYKHPLNIGKTGYPWAFTLSSLGDWALKSCKIIGSADDKATLCVHYNAYDLISDFAENGWLRLYDTEFEYCGFNGNGRRLDINNVTFKNSLRPFAIRKGTEIPQGDVKIKDLTLLNVFENSIGSGGGSSFAINNSHLGDFDIDGLKIIVDPKLLAKKFLPAEFTRTIYCGFLGGTGLDNCAANGFRATVKNVEVIGFYKRLKAFAPAITGGCRDWERPALPPANTDLVVSSVSGSVTSGALTGTVSGTTVNGMLTDTAVTGTATQNNSIASRTLGGRTTATWKDCSMWGDYA